MSSSTRLEAKRLSRRTIMNNYVLCIIAALLLRVILHIGSPMSIHQNIFSFLGSINEQNVAWPDILLKIMRSDGLLDPIPSLGWIVTNVEIPYSDIKWLLLIPVIAFHLLVVNPVRFFVKRHYKKNTMYCSERSDFRVNREQYVRILKAEFFRDAQILILSLLLIIPGIIRSLELAMVDYILIDHPDFSSEEALQFSKKIMMGHKCEYFLLILSFLGWDIMDILTLGISGIFWSDAYKLQTEAWYYSMVTAI